MRFIFRKEGSCMTKQNQKASALSATLVICAILARILGKFNVLLVPLGLVRTMIYIGLYIGWGLSVSHRILQTQVRRYMIGVSFLTVFWFVVRSVKYFFVTDPVVIRYLWYWYYCPMLLIPLLSVFVAMSLGKPENYRLPKWARLLYVPTLFFLLLVLTNDLHQLVFSFPAGSVWSDADNGYAYGYYLVMGWIIACALTAFMIMLIKCRGAQRRKYLPALLLSCSIIYAFIYASGARWMQVIGGDLTAAQCLMFIAILESCIQCGLIQTNTGYEEIFKAGTFRAQITDHDHKVCYASADPPVLSAQVMCAADRGPFSLDKHTLLKSCPIKGGHVYWQEDITEITALLEKLEENREAIAESNHLAQENYRVRLEIHTLREKNRLYDLLQKETARQIRLLNDLFSRYNEEEHPKERRRLLAKITVIGAYIKRKGNLIFIREKTETTDTTELALCIEESFANLKLTGAECEADIPGGSKISTRDAILIYDFLEEVMETAIDDLRFVWLKARILTDSIILRLEVECESSLADFRNICESCAFEDGVWCLILRIGKAGGQT